MLNHFYKNVRLVWLAEQSLRPKKLVFALLETPLLPHAPDL